MSAVWLKLKIRIRCKSGREYIDRHNKFTYVLSGGGGAPGYAIASMGGQGGKSTIDFVDFSGKQRIKAPLKRRFWYFVTLGKYGDLYHYKHVPMRKYYPILDSRTSYDHQMLYGKPVHRDYNFISGSMINCRCSIKPIKE